MEKSSKLSNLVISIESSKFIDGDFQDFVVGETSEFALKFDVQRLVHASASEESEKSEKSVEFVRSRGHRIRAEVVSVASTFWEIDFGFRAFCYSKPPFSAAIGDYVEGEIDITPFFHEERLRNQSEISKITCNWKIESILQKYECRKDIDNHGQVITNCNGKVITNSHGQVITNRLYPHLESWGNITKTEARVFGSRNESYELTLQKIT